VSGELVHVDFQRREAYSQERLIEEAANIAAAIGLREGKTDPAILDELKSGLAERFASLNAEEQKEVDQRARQKIDERNHY
jgi:hypothetical protein